MNPSTSPLRSPLFWRLLISVCIANVIVLMLGGLLTHSFIAYSMQQDFDWPAMAQAAEQAYEKGGDSGLGAWVRQEREQGVDATLYENGGPLRDIRLPPPVRDTLPDWLSSGHDIALNPWPGFYIAVQNVTGHDGHVRQLVAVSSSRTRIPRHTREKILLGVQLGLSLLLIAIIGWWVARSVSRPVEAMRAAARKMAGGEFSTRVDRRWSRQHDELGQLARDFNGMAERIEHLVVHERGVLQDLSHELRSPLARLQLILDLAQHSTDPRAAAAHFERAEHEIARMDRMTAEMLALSRLEGSLPGMVRESIDLAALTRDRVAAARIDAEARGIVLQWTDDGPVAVQGSGILLERALDNVLANAIKFSPPEAAVQIDLGRLQSCVELHVRDHGPGVPSEELELLFRPFFRGKNAVQATGHGLGLAIVQRVMHAHGGEVMARNLEGGGLEVVMRLPLQVSTASA
ncbi:sensor histidine kinase [Dyella choica]|uniref:histidine kinase n=1 Tax=Dyella choica TaxID=1927959 RepID=A0A432M4Q2_9GAMM|nr:HAMP domain-containing sensor histidine kinase [Dyella choica]RUL74510.1 HAMP domain-containing histidine kinase [Dyella choica]